MQLDEELCLCFHVTRRKVENYIRIERPQRVAQLSDCYGAGTGCGYCRPYLARLFKQCQGEQIESGVRLHRGPPPSTDVRLTWHQGAWVPKDPRCLLPNPLRFPVVR